MGWLWGSSSNESEAVRSLDPSLRKFLEDEKPAAQPATTTREGRTNVGILRASEPAPTETPSKESQVPKESLYQDGRYAHLWKNYRPLHEIEQAGKSDQDRMTDLVDSITERKYQLKTAAIENCAVESLAIQDCYRTASTWQMLTLCRAENRAFDRCFEMQGKFLRALGFTAQVGDDAATEKVQIHADNLYRQMLEQEKQRKEAEDKGLPVPEFAPIMSKENIARAMGFSGTARGGQTFWDQVKPEKRKLLEERLQGKSAEERELEMRLIENELNVEIRTKTAVAEIHKEEREARTKRKLEGQATFSDKAKRWWGWAEGDDR